MKDYLSGHHPDLIKIIDDTKTLTEDDEKLLSKAIEDWKKTELIKITISW